MKFSTNFIAATENYATFYYDVNAPYLRKSFNLSSDCKSAEILICGLGFYELYINGDRVTKGHLAPYVSNPDHIYYYDKYDVASYLKKGENVIGIMLGNGFQNNFGGAIWDFDRAAWRSAPKVALSFAADLADADTVYFEADESFKVSDSPIIFDDYRIGEYYDANLEQDGWNMPGFDDSAWKNAIPASTPKGEPKLCEAEPIVATHELKPVSITEYDGGYLYDFGANCAGVCRLKINGKKGQVIELQHGELIKDGKLSVYNILFDRPGYEYYKTYTQTEKYICRGDCEETYVPSFVYYGFQYVYVKGITKEQATEDLLTYLVMNSDLKEVGNFECSDETINKLQEMTRRSDLANFYYFPTDCPQREKNGWTGDASMSSEHMLLNLSAENSLKEWLYNICKAQKESGEIPGIVPTHDWGYGNGDWNGPAWDSVLTWVPYYIYKYRGDISAFEIVADNVYRYLKYINATLDERGVINYGLGDWCQPSREPNKPDSPIYFTNTIMAMDICEKSSLMFGAIGKENEKEYADNLAKKLRENVRKHFIDFDTMTAHGNCQTSQSMALYFNVFDEDEKARAFDKLIEIIEKDNDHLAVGLLGLRVLFHTLSDFGRADLAYKMIAQPTWPSYGNWVSRGATSLWEMFIDEMGEPSGASLNHHFFGDISSWFIKAIAGINLNPGDNNVNEVLIAPHFIDELNYVKAYHNAPAGKVEINWKRNDNEIELCIEMPREMSGVIALECGYSFENGESSINAISGRYKVVRENK